MDPNTQSAADSSSTAPPTLSPEDSKFDPRSTITYYSTVDIPNLPILNSVPSHYSITVPGSDTVHPFDALAFRYNVADTLNDATAALSKQIGMLSSISGDAIRDESRQKIDRLISKTPSCSAVWIDGKTHKGIEKLMAQMNKRPEQEGYVVLEHAPTDSSVLTDLGDLWNGPPRPESNYEITNAKIYTNPFLEPDDSAKSRAKLQRVAKLIKSSKAGDGWPNSGAAGRIVSEFEGCGTVIVDPGTFKEFRGLEDLEGEPQSATPSAAGVSSSTASKPDTKEEEWTEDW
ncbi:hypothetical protein IAT38_006026 [Cryptococcus sp. DSM 104549]